MFNKIICSKLAYIKYIVSIFAQKLQTQNSYVKTKLLHTNIIVRKRYRLNFKYKSHILYQKFVMQSIKYFKIQIQIQKLYLLHLA